MVFFNATAHFDTVFHDVCLTRWSIDDAACKGRWQRWLDLRQRSSRRKQHVPPFFQRTSRERPVVALGIVSALGNSAHRLAIRRTWLRHDDVLARFFVAAEDSSELRTELTTFDDIEVCRCAESYRSTVKKVLRIFQWGVHMGAFYVGRANDDVYLRLEPTKELLYKAGPPARVFAGLFMSGMRVPRLEDIEIPPGQDPETWLDSIKAWTVTRRQYPGEVYPLFAQGNAYFLSYDLAVKLQNVGPWIYLPDDVMTGLVVDAVTAGNFRRVDVPTDYELEGLWTSCSDDSLWHFNIHPEHMYDLHLAEKDTVARAVDVSLDGVDVSLEFDDLAINDLQVLADDLSARYDSLRGAGCQDSHCLASQLQAALRHAPRTPPSSPCRRIPDRLFCCG